MRAAETARKRAYAPYSGYRVGAAVLAEDGTFHSAANMENVSYGASICAEQATLCRALAEGKKKFLAIAVKASDKKMPIPCGICRQVLWEIAGDLAVYVGIGHTVKNYRLSELYPVPFESQKRGTKSRI